MRAVVQVSRRCALSVDEKKTWDCGRALTVLLGIAKTDNKEIADQMIDKLLKLRIFPDEQGKINRSALQVGADIPVISNFTLYANCASSRRPDFARAMGYEEANALYDYFVSQMEHKAAEWAVDGEKTPKVYRGVFGGDMLLEIHNDGPLTVILDSAEF